MSLNQLFVFDAGVINRRIRARLSLSELFGLGFAVCMVGVFLWLQSLDLYAPFDFDIYAHTVFGDLENYYYASWIIPLFAPFAVLPHALGFALWNLVNILGVFLAARVFGGKALLALISYQFLYILFYGQVTGLIAGCLALFWWAAANKRWHLAGLALLVAAAKFQVGVLIGGLLWLLAGVTWRERLRMLIVPAGGFLLSLAVFPNWIPLLYERLVATPPMDYASISVWRWIGPYGLLLLVIPLLVPMTGQERVIALICGAVFSLPYFQQADLVSLFVFPTGWFALLGYLGVLFHFFNYVALQLLFIIPAGLYLYLIITALLRWKAARRAGAPVTTNTA